ncbi:hypothetical protein [Helicobacter vulpis]|uniref:hypothetical protein n=1 Tax=Helicobacter vulpis TaxID=2316076 RepID=UPI0013CE268E|nr:hypothetical protein [Helicobacter vulpis]
MLGNALGNNSNIRNPIIRAAISTGATDAGSRAGSYIGRQFGGFIDRVIEDNALPRNTSHHWTGWYMKLPEGVKAREE